VTQTQLKTLVHSRLKTRQLCLLVYLDDHRSVLRAAESAGMTQPAASKLLREIEAVVDARLFERHARGVVPTWYGEILVRHARLALLELNLAHEEIAALRSGRSGKAAIGTVLSPGTNLVPLAVTRVKQQHPGLLISIEIDSSKPLVEKLLQGELDMLVARVWDWEGAEGLRFEPLADECHAVIAGSGHPLAGKHDLRLEDLIDQSWVLPPPGSLVRDKLMNVFLDHGLSLPRNIVQTASLPMITSLLRMTHMIAPIPRETVQAQCDSGDLTVLVQNLGVVIGSFGIITRREHRLSSGAQLALEALREAAATLYGGRPAAARPAGAARLSL
jgi:DNA-binding transcriptional LysR family regulator